MDRVTVVRSDTFGCEVRQHAVGSAEARSVGVGCCTTSLARSRSTRRRPSTSYPPDAYGGATRLAVRLARTVDNGVVNVQEIVSVISATGGVLIGLAGIGVSYSSARGQRSTTLLIAQEQARNSASLADTERQQRRLERAYSDLMEWVTKCDDLLRAAGSEVVYAEDLADWTANRELIDILLTNRPLATKRDSFLWSDITSEHVTKFAAHAMLVFKSSAELAGLKREGVDVDKRSYAKLMHDRIMNEEGKAHKEIELLRKQIRLELVGVSESVKPSLTYGTGE